MTSRTKRILILAGLLVAVLLLILFFLRGRRPPVAQPVPTTVPGQELPETNAVVPTPSSAAAQAERVATSDAQTVAKIFTERYGSYSNEANFANIRDVLPLATPAYRAELEAYMASAAPPQGFYAVTTRLVSVKVDAMDEAAGTATFTLSTQRTEAKNTPQNITTKYQDVVISLQKQGDTWLISGASWK